MVTVSVGGGEAEHHAMERTRKLDEPGHGYEYCANVSATRAVGDYTPRLLPGHPVGAVVLEAHEIVWQR